MVKISNKLSIALTAATMVFAGGVQAQSTMAASRDGYSMYAPGSAYLGFNIGQSMFPFNLHSIFLCIKDCCKRCRLMLAKACIT